MKKTLLLSSLLVSFSSFSADVTFNWLNSTSGQNSALSGTCNSVASSTDMTCNLRQLSISKKSTLEEVEKEISNTTSEIDTSLKNVSVEQFVKDEFGDVCSQLPLSEDKISGNEVMYNQMVEICNAPTRNKIIDMLSYAVKLSGKTCKVIEYDTGDFLFTQVNDNKWVSTNKPSGQCGAVTILTLEKKPKYDTLWSYSQVRHYTNTESELCKGLSKINEPMSYSWKGKSPVKMNCEYIEFGL